MNLKILESFKISFLKTDKFRGKSVSEMTETCPAADIPKGIQVQIACIQETYVLTLRFLRKAESIINATSLPVSESMKLIMIYPLTNPEKFLKKSFPGQGP